MQTTDEVKYDIRLEQSQPKKNTIKSYYFYLSCGNHQRASNLFKL